MKAAYPLSGFITGYDSRLGAPRAATGRRMFQHQCIWLPDGEKHLVAWMSRNGELVDGLGTYQVKKLRAALEFVRDWRTAVDIGAHVGLWTIQLAKKFMTVRAFEPVGEFAACWERNLAGAGNCAIHAYALGARHGWVGMRIPPGSSGGTHIVGPGDIEMRTLDSFELEAVDFMKIDCEGYEHDVVEGAVQTLKRCRPCVIVEQKPHIMAANFGAKGTPAVEHLLRLGAKQRLVLSGDHILSWDRT